MLLSSLLSTSALVGAGTGAGAWAASASAVSPQPRDLRPPGTHRTGGRRAGAGIQASLDRLEEETRMLSAATDHAVRRSSKAVVPAFVPARSAPNPAPAPAPAPSISSSGSGRQGAADGLGTSPMSPASAWMTPLTGAVADRVADAISVADQRTAQAFHSHGTEAASHTAPGTSPNPKLPALSSKIPVIPVSAETLLPLATLVVSSASTPCLAAESAGLESATARVPAGGKPDGGTDRRPRARTIDKLTRPTDALTSTKARSSKAVAKP